jgi:hypothetical protein
MHGTAGNPVAEIAGSLKLRAAVTEFSKRAPILTAYVAGKCARAIEKMSDEETIALALQRR